MTGLCTKGGSSGLGTELYKYLDPPTTLRDCVLPLFYQFLFHFVFWFRRQFLGSSSYNWLCQCYRRWGNNCWIKTEPISLQGDRCDIETIKWERHAKTQTYWSPNCENTQKNNWISLEGLFEMKLCHALCITWFLFPLNWKSGYHMIPLVPSLSRNILNI